MKRILVIEGHAINADDVCALENYPQVKHLYYNKKDYSYIPDDIEKIVVVNGGLGSRLFLKKKFTQVLQMFKDIAQIVIDEESLDS